MLDDRLHELESRQYGSFSRRQALEAGADDDLLLRRVRAGRLLRTAPGVYSAPGWPDSWMRRLWINHLDIGPGSIVSHEAAAALRGLHLFPRGRQRLLVPNGAHHRKITANVVQVTDLRPSDVSRLDGLPVTTAARTYFDLSSVTPSTARLAVSLDDAHVRGLCTIAEVRAIYDELHRKGKPGMRRLAAVLGPRGAGYVPPESVLEQWLDRVLEPLPWKPVRQAALPWRSKRPGRVDRLFLPRVIVEADGRSYHARLDQMEEDRRRDREAQLHGLDVYRFMWAEIRWDPGLVRDTVTRAMRLNRAA